MAKNITPVLESQTFQNWLNKTNEMVSIFQTDAITASGTNDVTQGDATLNGDFTATNLIATNLLSTDTIASRTNGGTIDFDSPVQIIGTSSPITATFNYAASGGQVRFTDGNLSWDVGIETSNPGNFVIDTGVAPTKFELSTAGTLTVPNIVCLGSVQANNFVGAAQFDDTDDIPEGSTNLYFTEARARAALSAGNNIDISAIGEISVENTLDITQLRMNGAGGASTAAYIDGGISVGQPQGRFNITFGGGTSTVARWTPSGLEADSLVAGAGGISSSGSLGVNGNITATGNLVTNGTVSDSRLKENLFKIQEALFKVDQISGYTFNYVGKTERMAGVVAQEVERVLPELVFDYVKNGNETYKAVRYDNMVALLIEAIKELKGKVDDLESRLDSSGT